MSKTTKNRQVTNELLEKSKALRERSKATGIKLNELSVQLEKLIQLDKKQSKEAT